MMTEGREDVVGQDKRDKLHIVVYHLWTIMLTVNVKIPRVPKAQSLCTLAF